MLSVAFGSFTPALPAADAGTGTIVGQVVNAQTGRGVAGAVIAVAGIERTTTSDLEGGYRFAAVPTGLRGVTVSKP
jgi:hypothetical protein